MSKCIVSIPTDDGLIFLRAVNFKTNEIILNGNPTKLTRKEKFIVEGKQVITDNYHFPIDFLYKLCIDNHCIDEDGNLLDVEL